MNGRDGGGGRDEGKDKMDEEARGMTSRIGRERTGGMTSGMGRERIGGMKEVTMMIS